MLPKRRRRLRAAIAGSCRVASYYAVQAQEREFRRLLSGVLEAAGPSVPHKDWRIKMENCDARVGGDAAAVDRACVTTPSDKFAALPRRVASAADADGSAGHRSRCLQPIETVHTGQGRKILTKRYRRDGERVLKMSNYDKAFEVRPLDPLSVASPSDLLTALRGLSLNPHACVILGEFNKDDPRVVEHLKCRGYVRRTKIENLRQGKLPFFRECPRSIYMIDFDPKEREIEFLRAKNVDLFRDSAHAATVVAREFLPPDIAAATLVYQFSGGAGIGEDGSLQGVVAKLHFFVILMKPMMPIDFKQLINAHNATLQREGFRANLLDPQLYSAVQPHYIAAPAFMGGEDPILERWGMLEGQHVLAQISCAHTPLSCSGAALTVSRLIRGPRTHVPLNRGGKKLPSTFGLV